MSTNTPPSPDKTPWAATMRTVARYTHLGWTLALSVVLGVFGGRWADSHWDTEPWFLLLGAFLGIGIGLYHFIKAALYTPSDTKAADGEG